MSLMACRAVGEPVRIGGPASDDNAQAARRALPVCVIHGDARLDTVQRVLPDAAGDADHGHPRCIGRHVEAAGPDPFADRILPRPELLGHPLVDDHDSRGIDSVLVAEEPALDEGDAHGPEE